MPSRRTGHDATGETNAGAIMLYVLRWLALLAVFAAVVVLLLA